MKILCVGMIVCDILIFPVPDDILCRDSVAIHRPVISCGGDALNVAMGLSKLGVNVMLAGRIADDANGAFIRKACVDAKIDTRGLINDKTCATATTFALIDAHGERHFLSEKEIFTKLRESDIPQELLEEADIVYFGSVMAMSGMNNGGLAELFRRAKAIGKLTVMDAAIDETKTSLDWMNTLAPVFEQTDIFFPSIDEARLITGKESPKEIADCFRSFNMRAFGIKLGAQGCYVTDYKSTRNIPGITGIPVVDTTGAGDSFMAGFLCGISRGWDVFLSAEFANTVAAQSIGAVGGTIGIPDFQHAMHYYQQWKRNSI